MTRTIRSHFDTFWCHAAKSDNDFGRKKFGPYGLNIGPVVLYMYLYGLGLGAFFVCFPCGGEHVWRTRVYTQVINSSKVFRAPCWGADCRTKMVTLCWLKKVLTFLMLAHTRPQKVGAFWGDNLGLFVVLSPPFSHPLILSTKAGNKNEWVALYTVH